MTTDRSQTAGPVTGPANLLLRAEGAGVLVAAGFAYGQTGLGWGLFALLFLVPDVFMLGYVRNPRLGAAVYNLGHTYVTPAILVVLALMTDAPTLLGVAFIWLAHIGFDRMLGYGLKYPSGFKHSHLSWG